MNYNSKHSKSFYRNLITTQDIRRIRLQLEHISPKINPLQTYPNLMQPKIVLERIGQGFLIDCLEPSENTQEYSFCDSKSTAKIKTERKSYGQKRKQSVSEDDDDDGENDSSRIALRKRKSISIVEIDDVTRKRRRNKRPKSKHIPFVFNKIFNFM